MAQLAYNKKLESTGKTPFYANYGRHLNLFTQLYSSLKTEVAITTAKEMKKTYKELRESLDKAQQRSISYVNQKRKIAP